MKRDSILLLLIALLWPAMLSAQSLTNREKRYINTKVLQVVEEYERTMVLYGSDLDYEFAPLFLNDASVKSDIMGSASYFKKISIGDYVKQLKSLRVYPEIRNVRKHQMQFVDGKWRIPVTFQKQLYYYDDNGVYFDIRRFYEGNLLNMDMYLLYDPSSDICYIESIDYGVSSSKKFPDAKFLIVDSNADRRARDERYFSMLKVDDSPLQFDENGYALYDANTEFMVDDFDVEVKKLLSMDRATDAYNFVNFEFSPRTKRAKLRLAFAPFAYSVLGGNNNVSAKSSAFDFGGDFGLMFRPRSRSKMSLYVGAGLSFSNLSLSLNGEMQYQYKLSEQNKDNGLYKATTFDYTIKDAHEKVKYTDLYVPIYFEMEHRLGRSKRLMLTWNIGVKSYLNLGAKLSQPYEIIYSIKEDDPITSNTSTFDTFIEANTYAKNLFDLSAIANIGLDCNVVDNRLYISAHVGYEYGILNSYSSKTAPYSVALIPKVQNNNIEQIAVHSLISGLQTKRNALWI